MALSMPRLRCSPSGAVLTLLLGSVSQVAGATDSYWFGAGCTNDAVAVVSVGTQEILVSVQTAPNEPGESDTILQMTDGSLWVRPESLQRWRATVPKESIEYEGSRWTALRVVPGLLYRFDNCTQTLWVDAAAATRSITQLDLLPTITIPTGSARIEPGGYFNLDTQVLHSVSGTQWAGLGELGAFNARGYGASSFVANQDQLVRLDTVWSVDDPESLQRFRAGDVISRDSTFGQSVRLGGVQWGRQFSLRPDIITYPLPSFRGSAALASSVDVYVNQTLRSNQDVPSGPFELNRIPVVAGQGDVQLVVRDVLGREQVVSYPFYAAPVLLREGLTDYTVEAGWLRNSYAVRSADYGRFLAAATYREGLSDTLTAEAHTELLHGQQLLAFSGAWLQPMLGVFSAGIAGSEATDGVGGGMQLGFERVSRVWNFSAEVRRASPRFARAGDGPDPVRKSELARVGFVPHVSGSLSLSYLHQVRDTDGDISILGLTYGYSFAREWNLFVSATRATSQIRNDSILVGLNWQFAQDYLSSSEFSHEGGNNNLARFTVQRTMQSALDYSWRASAESGANARRDVHGQWTHERGTLSADAERNAGDNNYRLGYSTGFALLGTDAFWTRPVDGSFAVVDTQGVPDVRIYADERMTGRTDSTGKLLVPNLRTYETTYLRIEDSDVPIAYEMADLRQPIFLPTRGGTRAQFSVHAYDGVILRLRLQDGSPVPAGAQVAVPGIDASMPVGFDGQTYLDRPAQENRLEARWPGHRCLAYWTTPQSDTVDVRCEEVKP
jgi:outer membrane usher protein